jgi:hypothetical protein
VFRKRLDPEWNELADEIGAPREWVACPNCGAQGWRLPPHRIFEPCPLVVQCAEQLGLVWDAARMSAVRTGVGVEEIARAVREQLGPDQ